MSGPCYAEYKDSDVQWLGTLPKHWKVRRLKKLLKTPLMYGANEASDGYATSDPRYVRITDISENGELRDDTFRSLPMEVAQDYLLFDGDILLARSGATVGKSFIYRTNWGVCCFAGYLIRARLDTDIARPSYIYACLQSSFYWQYISSCQIQATIQNVSAEKYGEFVLPLPPIREQDKIILFLEHETTKIDALISEQEKLITLLAEKRQATISRAVTKGLNPNVSMKDTGIQWLGEIPQSWECLQLGRLCLQVSDGPHFSPSYVDDGVMFLSARNIKADGWSLDDAKYISEDDYIEFCKRVTPEKGDVLYTKGGTTGIARVVDLAGKFQVWVHIAVLKIDRRKANPYFVAFALNSIGCYEQAQLYTRGATNNDLGLTRLIKIFLTLPSMTEQSEIVTFLEEETTRLDALSAKAKRGIELLNERRSALISAAVTGKIDVRQVAQHGQSKVREAA